MDKCPDCNGELEKGCMIDHTYGAVIVQRYAKAEMPETPQKLVVGIHETDFNDIRRVITYRCTKCNKLFQYAQSFVTIPSLGARNRNIMIVAFGVAIVIMVVGFLSVSLLAK